MARKKKPTTEEEKLARKQHIKEELKAYFFMFLFIILFALMYVMFAMQSSLFGG